jgi:hypothetical protein
MSIKITDVTCDGKHIFIHREHNGMKLAPIPYTLKKGDENHASFFLELWERDGDLSNQQWVSEFRRFVEMYDTPSKRQWHVQFWIDGNMRNQDSFDTWGDVVMYLKGLESISQSSLFWKNAELRLVVDT